MTGYHFSNPFSCNLLESRKRKPFFTGTETLFLVEQFEKHKDILTAKFCSTETNRRKNEIWAEITMGLHMRNPTVKRTLREVKKKWKNIVSMAKKEAMKAASDPDSSPRMISDISQRVLDHFAYLPSLQNIQALENGQEDISEMRGYYEDGVGNNNDIFTLIKTDTRPTSPSEGSELSTTDGQDGEKERPSVPFGDAIPSTSASVAKYHPEIAMVDLIKCETLSTSPSVISDNSVNDCPLEETLKTENNPLEVPLNLPLPLANDQETESIVAAAGSTSTSIRPSNNKNSITSNENPSSEPLIETLPPSLHTDKLKIVNISSIRNTRSPNGTAILNDVNLSQQESYSMMKNNSKSRTQTPILIAPSVSSDGKTTDKIPTVSQTATAGVALTALCQSTLLTSNTSSCTLGAFSSKSHKQTIEELAGGEEPSQKKLKSIPSEYLELHQAVLLLEKEKLQIEIEKMKREVVNQEKMTEILDLAKDVFASLKEKV